MTDPETSPPTDPTFLSVKKAEIVHGPEVIAEKVADALRDADRFELPDVKPPLREALGRVVEDGRERNEPVGQHALSGHAAEVDDAAGRLEPGAETTGDGGAAR